MKKIAAILTILLVQCTAILAVIQPPADAGLQKVNHAGCHNLCTYKLGMKAMGNSLEQAGNIGIIEPGNRLNN